MSARFPELSILTCDPREDGKGVDLVCRYGARRLFIAFAFVQHPRLRITAETGSPLTPAEEEHVRQWFAKVGCV